MPETLWTDDVGPIKNVREGMHVFDVAGVEVGRVEFVRMGDPQAVTAEGQSQPGTGLFGELGRLIYGSEPGTSTQLAEHLTRVGFVKVDGKGALGRDVYVAADQIAAVADGDVQLTTGFEELVAER